MNSTGAADRLVLLLIVSLGQLNTSPRPLACHKGSTAALAPVSALCQIEQMPWEGDRPVKCLEVSQDVKSSLRNTPKADTQQSELEQA